jgi:hypothetical protein
MKPYQVQRVVDGQGIHRFVVMAIEDNGSERPLVLHNSEEDGEASAKMANLWWRSPKQIIKRARKSKPRKWVSRELDG